MAYFLAWSNRIQLVDEYCDFRFLQRSGRILKVGFMDPKEMSFLMGWKVIRLSILLISRMILWDRLDR